MKSRIVLTNEQCIQFLEVLQHSTNFIKEATLNIMESYATQEEVDERVQHYINRGDCVQFFSE